MPAAENQPHASGDGPGAPRPEHFPFRVLLAVPQALTIPIFGLSVEAQWPPVEITVSTGRRALARVVSGNLTRSLVSGRYGEHCLITSRRRVGPRVAVYSSWLAFPTRKQAEAFVADHPQLGMSGIEVATKAEHTRRSEDLRAAVAVGRYDLSRLKPRERVSQAREFVRSSEELDRLAWRLSGLQRLQESLSADPEGTSVG